MTAASWLQRWIGVPAPRGDWAAECPAGLPVPESPDCAATDCESVPLPALREGERACVTCLQLPGGTAAQRLSALGVLPGEELELIQRFPAFVLRCGYAEIAIDEELADAVRVRRL